MGGEPTRLRIDHRLPLGRNNRLRVHRPRPGRAARGDNPAIFRLYRPDGVQRRHNPVPLAERLGIQPVRRRGRAPHERRHLRDRPTGNIFPSPRPLRIRNGIGSGAGPRLPIISDYPPKTDFNTGSRARATTAALSLTGGYSDSRATTPRPVIVVSFGRAAQSTTLLAM